GQAQAVGVLGQTLLTGQAQRLGVPEERLRQVAVVEQPRALGDLQLDDLLRRVAPPLRLLLALLVGDLSFRPRLTLRRLGLLALVLGGAGGLLGLDGFLAGLVALLLRLLPGLLRRVGAGLGQLAGAGLEPEQSPRLLLALVGLALLLLG